MAPRTRPLKILCCGSEREGKFCNECGQKLLQIPPVYSSWFITNGEAIFGFANGHLADVLRTYSGEASILHVTEKSLKPPKKTVQVALSTLDGLSLSKQKAIVEELFVDRQDILVSAGDEFPAVTFLGRKTT